MQEIFARQKSIKSSSQRTHCKRKHPFCTICFISITPKRIHPECSNISWKTCNLEQVSLHVALQMQIFVRDCKKIGRVSESCQESWQKICHMQQPMSGRIKKLHPTSTNWLHAFSQRVNCQLRVHISKKTYVDFPNKSSTLFDTLQHKKFSMIFNIDCTWSICCVFTYYKRQTWTSEMIHGPTSIVSHPNLD